MKQKDTTIRDMIVAVVIVAGLTGVNTFIIQNRYEDHLESSFFITIALAAAIFTGAFYWGLSGDELSKPIRSSTQRCMAGTAISGILMLAALLLELGTDSFSIYGKREILLWGMAAPKKYLFDVWAVVWFPVNIELIFKNMHKEHLQKESVLYGSISVLGLTLEGILLFFSMSNIWLIDLMVLNTATIGLAIWKYVLPEKYIRKSHAVSALILYTMLRILLLPLQCNNQGDSFCNFFYTGNCRELRAGINEIVKNSTFWGTSEYLRDSGFVYGWLSEPHNPVMHLLFYGGWASVLILAAVFILFFIILWKLLGIKNGRKHKNWLIFASAAVMLTDRMVFGMLYSFGVPYPMGLPFLGAEGSIMDVMAFTLILLGAWENLKIQTYYQTDINFVPAEKILGFQENYMILNKEKDPYLWGLYDNKLLIIGEADIVSYDVEWYDIYGRDFFVFTTGVSKLDKKRFILEYSDGEWILPTDLEDSIQKEFYEQYMYRNKPAFMEDEMDDIEENSVNIL